MAKRGRGLVGLSTVGGSAYAIHGGRVVEVLIKRVMMHQSFPLQGDSSYECEVNFPLAWNYHFERELAVFSKALLMQEGLCIVRQIGIANLISSRAYVLATQKYLSMYNKYAERPLCPSSALKPAQFSCSTANVLGSVAPSM